MSAEDREIGGARYTVTPLRLEKWRSLSCIVSRYAGLMAAATASSASKNDKAKLGLEALAGLTMGINERDLVEVESLIGSSSFVIIPGDDKPKRYDLNDPKKREAHFTGNYASYMKWLAFGLEVNFRPLLSELAASSKAESGQEETEQSP
jgi:hypothetical protein